MSCSSTRARGRTVRTRFVLIALAALLGSGTVTAGERAGVVAAVRGDVRILRSGTEQPATSGDVVERGDTVRSGSDGTLQILLLDETTFTVGPSSTIAIDDFVFDPTTDEGRVDTRLVEGAFRFVTGRVARRRPEQMNVKLPAGNIGIRGTIVGVRIDAATGSALAVLLGPGRENDTGDPPGGFVLENAGVATDVARPGWGARVDAASAAPGDAFEVPHAELAALVESFAPSPIREAEPPLAKRESGLVPGAPPGDEITPHPPDGDGVPAAPPDEGAARPTGEPVPDGKPPLAPHALARAAVSSGADFATQTLDLGGNLATFQDVLTQQAQDPSGPAIRHITSFHELDQLSQGFGGEYIYRAFNVPLVSSFGGGVFDLVMKLQFGPKQAQWQLLNVRWPAAGIVGFGSAIATLAALPGGANPGPAVFSVPATFFETGSLCVSGCPTLFDTTLFSVGTQPAASADVKVTLDPPGTILGEGGVHDLPIDQVIP